MVNGVVRLFIVSTPHLRTVNTLFKGPRNRHEEPEVCKVVDQAKLQIDMLEADWTDTKVIIYFLPTKNANDKT